MIAMTRSACMTPSSISFASSLASATEWIGSLRTSIAEGTGTAFRRGSGGGDDAGAGGAGDGLGEQVERGDDTGAAGPLREPGDGLHLGTHRAGGEPLLGRDDPHGAGVDLVDGSGVGGSPAGDHV